MSIKLIITTAIIIAASLFYGNWRSDADKATISFTIKGIFGKVNGNITGLQTDIQFDENKPGDGSIVASVDAKTISTGSGLRNKHLRDEEQWFDTDKYPRISFRSKKIEKAANGYKVNGELTIKNVTRAVEIPFTFSVKENEAAFKGQFSIKREDYKLGSAGGSVGSEVSIEINVPVKK